MLILLRNSEGPGPPPASVRYWPLLALTTAVAFSGVTAQLNATTDTSVLTASATSAAPRVATLNITGADSTLAATAGGLEGRLATLNITTEASTLSATALQGSLGRILGGGRLSGPQSDATVRPTES